MQMMKIEDLKPHHRNSEFFDDMSGDKWNEFLESIQTSGVIEPIVITQDKVIVSGHQRVRACKELGITEIMTETKHYKSEDDVIKDLLETNIRQRGTIGGSELKLGRRIKELERIYGVKQGRPSKNSSNGTTKMTDQDIADMNGIDINTLKRAKSLTTLPSEIQDLIEQGTISPSTASRLIAKLSPTEQEELIKSLPAAKRLTQKQVQEYVEQVANYKAKAEKANELQGRIRQLQNEIKELEQRKPVLMVKEVVPDDYNSIKSDNARMVKEYKVKCQELFDLKDKLKAIEDDNVKNKVENDLKNDCIFFCAKCDDFIKKVGGYAYLSDKLDSLPEMERKSYFKCVQMIKAWSDNIIANMNVEQD